MSVIKDLAQQFNVSENTITVIRCLKYMGFSRAEIVAKFQAKMLTKSQTNKRFKIWDQTVELLDKPLTSDAAFSAIVKPYNIDAVLSGVPTIVRLYRDLYKRYPTIDEFLDFNFDYRMKKINDGVRVGHNSRMITLYQVYKDNVFLLIKSTNLEDNIKKKKSDDV